ncbi:MAG: Methyltransferase type 11 [Actinoallomurus sp.]|jgi:cyclopropane fatty-acyl-phospholipid synthase-like methyltransferase|nr:Methyltransferase type 11 [Actinoallomurus sp.]
MTYEETAVDQTIDRLLSEHPDLDASADGSLDNLDQFHIGGADAVDLLIATLALADGDRVLDIGSGFGGPARQIARRTAHHVVGIDLTPAYIQAARALTAKTGLSDLVQFQLGDIAAFQPDPLFQAAITMHVQMNVHDKTTWFGHIADSLAPGARLAVWEVRRPRPADAHRGRLHPRHQLRHRRHQRHAGNLARILHQSRPEWKMLLISMEPGTR